MRFSLQIPGSENVVKMQKKATSKGQFNLNVGAATHTGNYGNAHFDINQTCQTTWSAFSAMTDTERNMMLKGKFEYHLLISLYPGLITRCSTNQIEYICMTLNLRGSEKDVNGKVKLPQFLNSRTGIYHSNEFKYM